MTMDQGVQLMSSAAKAYELAKKNPNMGHDQILAQVSKLSAGERDQKIKIGMIAAATKTLSIMEQNPYFNEKQILSKVMQELPDILANANEDVKFNSVD